MSDETIQENGSSEVMPDGETEPSESVDLIDALPSRPLTTKEWTIIGTIDAVLNQRPVYTMNENEKRPNEDDDLGSFLLEIEGIGWRGYHYTPENGEWNITFTGENYNMILDMHEDYVLPHMIALTELKEEAEEKKQEILERSKTTNDSVSDSGANSPAPSDANTDSEDATEPPVDEPTTSNQDSTNDETIDSDSGATPSVE